MSDQNKVSGLVLAGGLARRMLHQDKGLILFNHQAMISYALAAMSPLVDELLISANRNIETYHQFGYRVICDSHQVFDGPLAGILAGMKAAKHGILLVTPCDSPLIQARHLQRLLNAMDAGHELATAFDGERLHPVFLAVSTRLQLSLSEYLHRGERKLENWLNQHKLVKVDFSDEKEIFTNINTFDELHKLEQQVLLNPVS